MLMSRKTQGASLPSRNARVGEVAGAVDETKQERNGATLSLRTPPVPQIEQRQINVAFGEPPGYSGPRKLSMRIQQPHLKTFNRLYAGLHNAHVRKANGRHVDSAADVFLYLLEEIAKSTPAGAPPLPPDHIETVPPPQAESVPSHEAA